MCKTAIYSLTLGALLFPGSLNARDPLMKDPNAALDKQIDKIRHLRAAYGHLYEAFERPLAHQVLRQAAKLAEDLQREHLARKEAQLAALQDEVDRLRAATYTQRQIEIHACLFETTRQKLSDAIGMKAPAGESPSELFSQFVAKERSAIEKNADSRTDLRDWLHTVNNKGVIKILSSPTLITLEGHDGWFSIGGEVPFPVEQSSGVVTIDYKRTGFECRFLPESVEKKQIRLRATLRQTCIDESMVACLGTFKAPALRTVELSRTVELAPNEAVVVGEFESADALAKLPAQSNSEKQSSSVTLVVISVRPLPRKHDASPQPVAIRQAASEAPAKK